MNSMKFPPILLRNFECFVAHYSQIKHQRKSFVLLLGFETEKTVMSDKNEPQYDENEL